MADFDHWAIDDTGLRTEFQHLALRAGNIGRSLQAAYGVGKKPIEFRFINEHEFNAFARVDARAYAVEVNAAVPLFSILLFSKLMADEQMLQFLDAAGDKASDFQVPFVIDPAEFGRRVDWRIELNSIRSFAAGTIADFCSTFVLCHEFGHILGGHAEGHLHYFGGKVVAELVSADESVLADSGLRQAWEHDADRFAAALVINFVEELADVSRVHPRTNSVFSDGDGFHFEHTLAICIASLLAFFTYVQGMRFTLDKRSSHPHPYVRATFLKHMLLQAARDRRPVDFNAFHDRLDRRLDETLDALERIGLFHPRGYGRNFMAEVDSELDRLQALSETHGDSCARWRWID